MTEPEYYTRSRADQAVETSTGYIDTFVLSQQYRNNESLLYLQRYTIEMLMQG